MALAYSQHTKSVNMSEGEIWHDVNDKLPSEDDIYKVELDNGDKIAAYFYSDKIGWAAFYGYKTSYWWHKASGDAIDNVIKWKEHGR